MVILENIDTDIDMDFLENIDIDKSTYVYKYVYNYVCTKKNI